MKNVCAMLVVSASAALGGGCAVVADQRAAYGRGVDVVVDRGDDPFAVAVAANERLLAVDPAEVLEVALARSPGVDGRAVRLTLDPGPVRPSALRSGRFAALAPGAPPGAEAPELPRGVRVAGRLRLQAVVEHGPGGPRVAAQAVADFAVAGAAKRWEPLLQAIAEAAAERAQAEVLRAARAEGAAACD
ncbi:MAG: hypothetical protein M9894_23975 [Planctomycetes bacterium]|nr:hypothetical protein [Planctomycetota bacterium]